MKIVILAAGIGSRLGNPFPKPLTKLNNGKSIMEMQINNITSRFDIDDINVVVGFKKDLIMERFPNLTYIYNPFFDRTNTSKSLLSALKKNKNSSILWFNEIQANLKLHHQNQVNFWDDVIDTTNNNSCDYHNIRPFSSCPWN